MIAEAIQKIRALGREADSVRVIEIDEQKFTDRAIVRVPNEPVAKPDHVVHSTLRSLVSYLKDNPDKVEDGTFLSVTSPIQVTAVTPVQGKDQDRKTYAVATASAPGHQLGIYQPLEAFAIYVRTCFVETEARNALVALISGVVDSTDVTQSDDGLSQSVQLRKGLSLVKEGETPGVVNLQPFRTFHDVEQPEVPFVLRLDKRPPVGVVAALFEADGGAWKHEATQSIATFLREQLGESFSVYA